MFGADVDGRTLTFDLGGLVGMNFVLEDRQTGTRWQQASGEAFEGPLAGKRLTPYPFLLTTWGEWQRRHPRTLVLVPEADRRAQYARAKRGLEQLANGLGGPMFGLRHEDARLPPRTLIMGLEVGGRHRAYPIAVLETHPVVNDRIGEEPVLVVYHAAHDTTTAFSRRLGDRTLTFWTSHAGRLRLRDEETGSVWNAYGECVGGPLARHRLAALTPLPSFWFAWAEFFPATDVYRPR